MNTLLERDWRVVHIAGHGEPAQTAEELRGVVLSGGTFLGPREINSMRVVPELVFVNCCHLGARHTAELLSLSHDRAAFAAGVAEKLIQIGVRAVVAAGWAVDDSAASAFATTFYHALLAGDRFIDAVSHAREAALALGGNTWAAYQCYGDPDWRFRPEAPDAQRPASAPASEFAGIASPSALRIALETLAVRSRFQGAKPDEQKVRLRYLEHRFGVLWGGIGEVAEGFADAWSEAGDRSRAIRWYRKAIGVEDSTASFRAAEQLSNMLARVASEHVESALERARGRKKQVPKRVTDEARGMVTEAMALLDKLLALEPTLERESIYGSACKRLASIEMAAGRRQAEVDALEGMKRHYENAERIGRGSHRDSFFYPAMNRMAADLAINAGRAGWAGLDRTAVADVREALASKVARDPDFWSVAAQTELTMFQAIARGDLSGKQRLIEKELDDLHTRVSAPRYWASLYDTGRFVLHKYVGRATGPEGKAATAVLERLNTYARG